MLLAGRTRREVSGGERGERRRRGGGGGGGGGRSAMGSRSAEEAMGLGAPTGMNAAFVLLERIPVGLLAA
jgi:hypothetical protein